jgi:hypothetical protein
VKNFPRKTAERGQARWFVDRRKAGSQRERRCFVTKALFIRLLFRWADSLACDSEPNKDFAAVEEADEPEGKHQT